MFKNIQAYRLPQNWPCTAAQLEAYLKPHSFVALSSSEMLRSGWASPRDNDQLVHVVNRQYLIQLKTQKKLLPASVINQVAKERAAELEEVQGFAPGKKAMKELKECVAYELLPRAFPINSVTNVWIDPVNGWLIVDAATASKADDVLKHLLKAIDKFPVESVRVARPPVAKMTEWLQADEAPDGFTIDMDATMQATGESKASVSYKRHTLHADDVRRHIAAGKQCTRLAMTWDSKISFVLTESLSIKSVKALDVLEENTSSTGKNSDERFDSDFMLMTGEFAKMLDDLLEALGGEAADLVSPARARSTPSMERSITLTAQLYATRTSARLQLGDDYADAMETIGREIEKVMRDKNLGVVEAAMDICKENTSGNQHILVMAAAVELVEPSEVAA